MIGVDVRDQYLDFAEERAREEDLRNVGFRRADVFELPFPDGTFNVVWAKYLLQWLKDPKTALAELKRVTKPGGVVVSCDYSGSPPNISRSMPNLSGSFGDLSPPLWIAISAARWRRS